MEESKNKRAPARVPNMQKSRSAAENELKKEAPAPQNARTPRAARRPKISTSPKTVTVQEPAPDAKARLQGENAVRRFGAVSAAPKKQKQKKLGAKRIVKRTLLCLGAGLLFLLISVYTLLFSVAYGPSETVRNTLVLSAMQASATKWVPGLFLSADTVDKIISDSEIIHTDEIDIDDYNPDGGNTEVDEWANAIDGMRLIYESRSTFKAYVLLIKDPSRVFVGPSMEYSEDGYGKRIFEAASMEGAIAAINAGEYPDNGFSTGSRPLGITYSKGELVWKDEYIYRTFIGFDENDRLVVREGMTEAVAEQLGVRDGVCFKTGNVLISNGDGKVNFHYANGNNGVAQRTAIGQRADGTVIMIVTDGRSASSLGATRNDIIDMLKEYGAVSAGMLDGGSSSMLYYENYFEKYSIDKSRLDSWQLQGLVNKYKAFTSPRHMPTFFLVGAEVQDDA